MKPNFLIFVVDQMASRSLGCNGNPDVRTPNIDRLAAAGTSFRRAYCNNPVCQPSRATMLTGLTPRQHGLVSNGNALDVRVPTITAALAASGYRTHSVGKLHLQPYVNIDRRFSPDEPVESWESEYLWRRGRIERLPADYYGFQTAEFIGGHGYFCFGDYTNWLHRVHPDPSSLHVEGDLQGRFKSETMKNLPPELHYNHWIADRAMAFLEDTDARQPLFLWCSFPDPHHPFSANRKYADAYDQASLTLNPTWRHTVEPCPCLLPFRAERPVLDEAFLRKITAETYAMISHIDEQVGRVLDKLEQSGRARNTIVVFMSDHGEYLGSHGLHQKEIWPYEELDRIPCIWRTPRGVHGPSDAIVSMLDFVPTILDYAGLPEDVLDPRAVKPAQGRFLPGRSLRPWIDRGEQLAARPAVIEFDRGPDAGPRTLVESRWKLTVFPPTGQGALFDLEADPGETRNRWDDPACAVEKQRMLHRLLEELVMSDRFDQSRIATS